MIDKKEDFSTQSYKQLINFISKNYSPIFFDEYLSSKQNKLVLLRHDIDISLLNSLTIAKIEYDFGMKSTFFVNIHSDFYNFFEKGSIAYLKEILKLGHSIGIHFDGDFWNLKDELQLIKNLKFEKAIIDEVLGIKANVFSFHNPTKFTLSFKNDKYAGIINTYSNGFMNDFKYSSDSNGHWRHERMFDIVESLDYDRLHLLTHPGWWTTEIKHPREKIYASIYERAKFTLDNYDQTLSNSNRENFRVFTDQLFFIKDFSSELFNLIDRLWNEKNYFQLHQELLRTIKLQLSVITKFYSSDGNFKVLNKKNLLDEISYHVTFIKKNAIEFTELKNQINKLICTENIVFETDKVLFNHINSLISLIKELNFFSKKLNQ